MKRIKFIYCTVFFCFLASVAFAQQDATFRSLMKKVEQQAFFSSPMTASDTIWKNFIAADNDSSRILMAHKAILSKHPWSVEEMDRLLGYFRGTLSNYCIDSKELRQVYQDPKNPAVLWVLREEKHVFFVDRVQAGVWPNHPYWTFQTFEDAVAKLQSKTQSKRKILLWSRPEAL
ncbi:MAG: hypothetical protein IKP96_00950 [Elusimicrobiaceae bacterium]|nr:hypothetical protein [Elusimicrobiaceae bacterium]